MTQAEKSTTRPVMAALTAICLVALALRLYRLDALSLWYDEGATLVLASGGLDTWIADTHPPLYYILMHLWLKIGQSEFWIRLLSVLPGVATIPVVFDLGRRMFGVRAGLLAAVFLAAMAFHILYSQEARMYALLTFLYACTLWSLVAAARDGQTRHWISYTIAAILLAYSQGIGIIYVAIIACLYPLISPGPIQKSAWRPFFLANLIVALLFLPWLLVINQADLRLGNIAWIPPVSLTSIEKTLSSLAFDRIPITAIIGKLTGIQLSSGAGVALAAIPVCLLAGIGIWQACRNGRAWAAATAILALILPMLAVYFLSVFVTPMYLNRVLLPGSIGFVLILGAAVQGKTGTSLFVASLIAINLAVSWLNTFYAFRYSGKEDFRALSQDLQALVRPEEQILFLDKANFGRALVDYYDPAGSLAAISRLELPALLAGCASPDEACLASALNQSLQSERIWIVYVHDHVLPPGSGIVTAWLDSRYTPVANTIYVSETLRLVEARALPQ